MTIHVPMRVIARRRWNSDRPFAGHTDESIHQKIRCRAYSPITKDKAMIELIRREQAELDVLNGLGVKRGRS